MEITNLKKILARGAATIAAGEKRAAADCKSNVNRESFLKNSISVSSWINDGNLGQQTRSFISANWLGWLVISAGKEAARLFGLGGHREMPAYFLADRRDSATRSVLLHSEGRLEMERLTRTIRAGW